MPEKLTYSRHQPIQWWLSVHPPTGAGASHNSRRPGTCSCRMPSPLPFGAAGHRWGPQGEQNADKAGPDSQQHRRRWCPGASELRESRKKPGGEGDGAVSGRLRLLLNLVSRPWWCQCNRIYRQDQLRIPAFLCRRKFVGTVGGGVLLWVFVAVWQKPIFFDSHYIWGSLLFCRPGRLVGWIGLNFLLVPGKGYILYRSLGFYWVALHASMFALGQRLGANSLVLGPPLCTSTVFIQSRICGYFDFVNFVVTIF